MTLSLKYIEAYTELWLSDHCVNQFVIGTLMLPGDQQTSSSEAEQAVLKLLDDPRILLRHNSQAVLELLEAQASQKSVDEEQQTKIRDFVWTKVFVSSYRLAHSQGDWHKCGTAWKALSGQSQTLSRKWLKSELETSDYTNISIAKALIVTSETPGPLKYISLLPETFLRLEVVGGMGSWTQMLFEENDRPRTERNLILQAVALIISKIGNLDNSADSQLVCGMLSIALRAVLDVWEEKHLDQGDIPRDSVQTSLQQLMDKISRNLRA